MKEKSFFGILDELDEILKDVNERVEVEDGYNQDHKVQVESSGCDNNE